MVFFEENENAFGRKGGKEKERRSNNIIDMFKGGMGEGGIVMGEHAGTTK